MALWDFHPRQSPLGGHMTIRHARIDANTLRAGEPILLEADGDAAAVGDDPAVNAVAGVALAPVGGALFRNPSTGTQFAAGDVISYVLADGITVYSVPVARVVDAAFAPVAVTVANIGDIVGIQRDAGPPVQYGISPGVGNAQGRIVDVLDAQGQSLTAASAGAAAEVLFTLDAYEGKA